MHAGNQPFKMITTVDIGDGICGVLKHHADTGNALSFAGIDGASAFGYATDKGKTFANAVADDADGRVDSVAHCAAIVGSGGKIDCVAGACVLPDFGQIGQQSGCASGQWRKCYSETAAIGSNRWS